MGKCAKEGGENSFRSPGRWGKGAGYAHGVGDWISTSSHTLKIAEMWPISSSYQ